MSETKSIRCDKCNRYYDSAKTPDCTYCTGWGMAENGVGTVPPEPKKVVRTVTRRVPTGRKIYRIPKEQFSQMCDFYRKLGYNDAQVKTLSENCFGYTVKPDENMPYKPDWSFWGETEYKEIQEEITEDVQPSRAFGAAVGSAAPTIAPYMGAPSFSPTIAPEMSARFTETTYIDTSAPVMRQAAAMATSPSGSAGMFVPSAAAPAEFNSAETRNPRENEPQSPMDSPAAIFSANVNTGSWSYIRNMLSMKKDIDKSFVRIEEILNSFPYKLDPPENGDPFNISTEYSSCPWNKEEDLLLVEMKAKKADTAVRQNLVFLIDVSGSMNDNWVLVQMSAAAIMSRLKAGDTLSIISYSDETKTVVKQLGCGDTDRCVEALLAVEGIGGCTYGSKGLENAYSYLSETYDKDANNRVFIFTDGDFNFGVTSEGGLSDFIYEKRRTGIYLSIVGYGMQNFKDNKMEALAMNGNGNYTFVSNPADILDNLWDKLVSNLITVAKDVKISVEMNPAYVSEYRLIGYDARQLTQKEFNDTEKAADGIGSEHNVVALIALKRGKAKQRYTSRYVTANTDSNKDEFAYIEVHYKSPDGEDLVYSKAVTVYDTEHGTRTNIPAASMLAVFGLLVKDSEYKGSASLDLLAKMIAEADTNESESEKDPYGHFSMIRKFLFRR